MKLSVKEAASLMGKSIEFVRAGLRDGRFSFGTAVKLSSRWSYHISPKLFYEYINGNEKMMKNNENGE